jgi:hypothetical protein
LINICFINIILTDYTINQLPLKLQTIIDCCAEQISITNGLLTKVFMFDKGLSLLCAFGMPGYKHPDGLIRLIKKYEIYQGFFRCRTSVEIQFSYYSKIG